MVVVGTSPGISPTTTTVSVAKTYQVQPVKAVTSSVFEPDARYVQKAPGFPRWSTELPKEWPGVVVHGTDENQESPDAFVPGFFGVVCVNREANPDLSTRFIDLQTDNSPHPTLLAHTHTAFAVADVDFCGMKEQVIAFQLDKAPQTNLPGFNFWVDYRKGALKPEYGVGASRYPFSQGPFEVGVGTCKHPPLGKDDLGNPIRPLHLSTHSLFLGHNQDGPLCFEIDPFPDDVMRAPHKTHVHLQYDVRRGHHFAGCNSGGDGKWCWWAESFIAKTKPPTGQPRRRRDPQGGTPGPGNNGRVQPKGTPPFSNQPGELVRDLQTGTARFLGLPPNILSRALRATEALIEKGISDAQAAFELIVDEEMTSPSGGGIPPGAPGCLTEMRCPKVGQPAAEVSAMVTNQLVAAGGLAFRAVATALGEIDLTRAAQPTEEEVDFTGVAPLTAKMVAHALNPSGTWERFTGNTTGEVGQFPGSTGGVMLIPPNTTPRTVYLGTDVPVDFTRFILPSDSNGDSYCGLSLARPDSNTGGINTGYDLVAVAGALAFNAVNAAAATVATTTLNADGSEDKDQIAAPGTPASGRGRLYVSSVTGNIHFIDDAGVDTDLTTSGAVGSQVPIGGMIPWGGDELGTIPTNYALCDGSEKNRVTFAALFAVIGVRYGIGDGSTTFNLPDKRGRTSGGVNNANLPNGANGSFATRNGGDTAGTESETLTTGQIPAHSHNMEHTHQFPHTHDVDIPHHSGSTHGCGFIQGADTSNPCISPVTVPTVAQSTTTTASPVPNTTATDGVTGGSHNNMQPTEFDNWLIRCA